MAKTPSIPSLLDADPQHKRTAWETIIVTTPVILTVMATVLAGLSSSEMSSAQYFRSIAAQMQSKVSDQWGYFQAKKLRAEQCGNTMQILQNITPSTASASAINLSVAANRLVTELKQAASNSQDLTARSTQIESLVSQINWSTTQPDSATPLDNFVNGSVPAVQEQSITDPKIIEVMQASDSNTPEPDLERMAGKIEETSLDQAFNVANNNTAEFESAIADQRAAAGKITHLFQQISSESSAFQQQLLQPPGGFPDKTIQNIHDFTAQLNSSVSVAGLRFSAARYDREAQYNQVLAQLFEIQVRRQSYLSERHRTRSKEFFYGMLGAQAGVTIATFSLALRRRNLLWGIAASAGLAAVTFAAYVYMFV